MEPTEIQNKDLPAVSVVIPIHNEEESLPGLYRLLVSELEQRTKVFELIFINENSTDSSGAVLSGLVSQDGRVRVEESTVFLGKSQALAAGFALARSDYIVALDPGLQDDPQDILRFLAKLDEGYDLVYALRKGLGAPLVSSIFSRALRILVRLAAGVRLHDFDCGYMAFRRKVLDNVPLPHEHARYLPLIFQYYGYKVRELEVERRPPRPGRKEYGRGHLSQRALDLMGIIFNIQFSYRPLRLLAGLAALLLLAGAGLLGYLALAWRLLGEQLLDTRPFFLAGIVLLLVGLALIIVGLISELKLKLKLLRDTPYSAARYARRLTRILAPFFVAVSLFALAIFAAIELNPGSHRIGFIQLAESRLNAKVGIGMIYPIFYPRPGIEFTNVRITLPDHQRLRPEFIKAKSVKIILDLRNLQRLHFSEIDLGEPEIYLELSPEETQRLAHLYKTTGKAPDLTTPELKHSLPGLIWNLIIRKSPSGFSANDFLNTERIFIYKASGTILDRRERASTLRAPLMFRDLDLGLTKTAGENNFDFWLSSIHPYGQAGLEPLPIKGKGKLFLSLKPFDGKFKFDEAAWGKNPLSQVEMEISKIEGKPLFQVSGKARMDLADLMLNARWDPIIYSHSQVLIKASGNSEMSFELTYPGKGKETSYQGTFHLQDATIDPGQLLFPFEKINAEVNLVRGKLTMLPSEISISGMPFNCGAVFEYGSPGVRPSSKMNCDITGLKLDNLFFPVAHYLALEEKPGTKKGPITTILSGEFTGKRVQYKKLVSDQVIGNMRFKDHLLDFPRLVLKYRAGSFEDAGTWLDLGLYRVARFHFRGRLVNFDFNPAFVEASGTEIPVDGKANGQGYLNGETLDGKVEIGSLNGYFKLLVDGGKIIGANPFSKVLQMIGFKVDQSKSGLQFDNIGGNLVIKDGVLYSDDISLKSTYLQARAAGQVDLNRQAVNLWAVIYVLQPFTATEAIPLEADTVSVLKPVLMEGASAELFQPPIGAAEKGKTSITGYYVKIEGPWKAIKIKGYNPRTENAPRAPEPPRFNNMPQIYKQEISER